MIIIIALSIIAFHLKFTKYHIFVPIDLRISFPFQASVYSFFKMRFLEKITQVALSNQIILSNTDVQ